jgi:hypothetical protein
MVMMMAAAVVVPVAMVASPGAVSVAVTVVASSIATVTTVAVVLGRVGRMARAGAMRRPAVLILAS